MLLFAYLLLNNKATWIKIAIEAAIGGGELQNAIVGIGYAPRVVLLVALAPNHLLALGIGQHLHRATKHHALETLGIAEIDAGLGIGLIVRYTQREGVCGKIKDFDALSFTWCQHGLGARITLVIYR